MFSQHLESVQHHTGEDFPHNAQQGDAAIVVTVTAVPFVLVECDDVSISHVLGNCSLLPTLK